MHFTYSMMQYWTSPNILSLPLLVYMIDIKFDISCIELFVMYLNVSIVYSRPFLDSISSPSSPKKPCVSELLRKSCSDEAAVKTTFDCFKLLFKSGSGSPNSRKVFDDLTFFRPAELAFMAACYDISIFLFNDFRANTISHDR